MSQVSHADEYRSIRIVIETFLLPVLLPTHIFFGCLGGASKKEREARKKALQKILQQQKRKKGEERKG